MRPFRLGNDGALHPDTASVLYAKRDTMTNRWRLAWRTPGENVYCYAEGECSAKLFATRRAAVAYGEKAYGEKASNWPFHF